MGITIGNMASGAVTHLLSYIFSFFHAVNIPGISALIKFILLDSHGMMGNTILKFSIALLLALITHVVKIQLIPTVRNRKKKDLSSRLV